MWLQHPNYCIETKSQFPLPEDLCTAVCLLVYAIACNPGHVVYVEWQEPSSIIANCFRQLVVLHRVLTRFWPFQHPCIKVLKAEMKILRAES